MQPLLEPGNFQPVVLPLSYLPSIDHYCFIVQQKKVLFEVKETYPKQTCRNRTTILTANGVLRLSIPVIKPNGNKTRTEEVIIDSKSNWNKIHWRAITSAYNKSPFFLYYKDEFEKLYNKPDDLLIGFNLKLIRLVNKLLKIKTEIMTSEQFIDEYPEIRDERNCSKDFRKSKYKLTPYTQVFSDRSPFVENLSIIDLLFNEGPHTLRYLLCCNLKEDADNSIQKL